MSNIFCYDVYPQNKDNVSKMSRIMDRHGFEERENKYGLYYHIEVDGMDTAFVSRVLKRYKYKYRKYEKRWDRSSNYRDVYFQTHHAPYHCVYCGKSLRRRDVEVDHLIPVAQTKKNTWAKLLLSLNTIRNVNDPRNLVASCHRCNQKKSDKMGIWILRGFLGRTKWFWSLTKITAFILCILVIYLLLSYWQVIPDTYAFFHFFS